MKERERLLVENLIKNVIVIVLLILLFQPIKNIIYAINPSNVDSVLLFSSMILVAVLFSNFAFTYELSNFKNKYERFLSHFITFLLMFLIGLLLEISAFSISVKVSSLYPLSILIGILVYISSILYDFWDILRIKL